MKNDLPTHNSRLDEIADIVHQTSEDSYDSIYADLGAALVLELSLIHI